MGFTKGTAAKPKADIKFKIAGSLDDPVCKNCLRRIHRNEPRLWSTDPHKLGLIHEHC